MIIKHIKNEIKTQMENTYTPVVRNLPTTNSTIVHDAQVTNLDVHNNRVIRKQIRKNPSLTQAVPQEEIVKNTKPAIKEVSVEPATSKVITRKHSSTSTTSQVIAKRSGATPISKVRLPPQGIITETPTHNVRPASQGISAKAATEKARRVKRMSTGTSNKPKIDSSNQDFSNILHTQITKPHDYKRAVHPVPVEIENKTVFTHQQDDVLVSEFTTIEDLDTFFNDNIGDIANSILNETKDFEKIQMNGSFPVPGLNILQNEEGFSIYSDNNTLVIKTQRPNALLYLISTLVKNINTPYAKDAITQQKNIALVFEMLEMCSNFNELVKLIDEVYKEFISS